MTASWRVLAATHGSGELVTAVFAANCMPEARQVGSMAADALGAGVFALSGGAIGGGMGESGGYGTAVGEPISAGGMVVGIGSGVICVCCGVGIGSGVTGCGGASGG